MRSVVDRNVVMWLIPVKYYKFRLQSSTCTFASKINIFIITIIYHELGLDKPVSASSNILFKGLPSRVRPFGLHFSIILTSWCSVLLHVVVSLIWISLASRQLVLFSTLRKFLHSFCGHLDWHQPFFVLPSKGTSSLPYRRTGQPVHYILLDLKIFGLTLVEMFRFPSIWEHFANFCWISFSFSYKIPQQKILTFRHHASYI